MDVEMTNEPHMTRTALIVEDEPTMLEVLDDILTEAGFATTCYERGQPALAALAERHFDVLIIDQWLPDMNGLRICDAARARYGNTTAILMVTADRRKEREILALERCVDDYVGKPFHVDELVARIKAKLRHTARTGA